MFSGNKIKKNIALLLMLSVTLGELLYTAPLARADEAVTDEVTSDETIATPAPDGQMSLNYTSINTMAGKTYTLKVSNLPTITNEDGLSGTAAVLFESSNTNVVTVDETGKAKAVKKGTATVTATVGSDVFTCEFTVVPAMSKADFGNYYSYNLISRWTNKKWVWGWAGEWGSSVNKYGSTYRDIKIGKTLADVKKAYGDFTTSKCKKGTTGKNGDPFLYDKGFNTSSKKLRVSKYADFVYKSGKDKYTIRIYFTSKNKVFGFILVKNISEITKFQLSISGGIKSI